MNITILGAGAYGKALGNVLIDNGHEIKYFDKFVTPDIKLAIYDDLSVSLEGAEMVVLAIPSEMAPSVLEELPHDLPLIVATKGFLSTDAFNGFDWMILSGAGFAKDLTSRKKMMLTATDSRVVELFSTDYLSFDETDDKLGVLLCGALKNVYAISAGFNGIDTRTKNGYNFLVEAGREIEKILEANGCRSETVSLSCGMMDLGISCTPESRNYNFGKMLARDYDAKPTETVEGYTTMKKIKAGAITIPKYTSKLNELLEFSWD